MASYHGVSAEEIADSLVAARAFVMELEIEPKYRKVPKFSEQFRAEVVALVAAATERKVLDGTLGEEAKTKFRDVDFVELVEPDLVDDELYHLLTEDALARALQEGHLTYEEEVDVDCPTLIREDIACLTDDRIQNIRGARTNLDLAEAVSEVKGTLIFMRDLFTGHGMRNTNGKGAKVAADLWKWDGLAGARFMVLTPLDRAIEAHLEQLPAPTAEQIQAYEDLIPPSFVGRYGIEVELKGEGSRDAARALQIEVSNILEEYRDRDEAGITALGFIGDIPPEGEKGRKGVIFDASRQAALDVARNLPEYEVIAPDGKVLRPRNVQPRAVRPGRRNNWQPG